LTATTAGRWTRAARAGVRDPEFARAGRALLALAADTLDDTSVPGDAVPADAVRNFLDRYTVRGRCPADDILEELR
jgi:glutamate--cysteine ligase